MKQRSIVLLAIAILVLMYFVGMREGYSQGGLVSLNSNYTEADDYLTGKKPGNGNTFNETRLSGKMYS